MTEVSFQVDRNKPKKDKESRLHRLLAILAKLANDERPDTKELAQEFGLTERAIQNDIYKALDYFFPIEKDTQGKFKLMDGVHISKAYLSPDEMMLVSLALSQFSDVSDFDMITRSTMNKLLQPQIFNPYYIKYDDLEDIDIDSNLIESIEQAIQEHKHIILTLTNDKQNQIEPYRITNLDGIWYLLAKDENDQKTKTFMISRIKDIQIINEKHKTSSKKIQKILSKVHSAWFEEGSCFDVKIKVYPNIAHFFKAKEHLKSQKIQKELDDGSLIINFTVTHLEDIDNIIKSWLPDIEVLEPLSYKEKIINELETYLKRIK